MLLKMVEHVFQHVRVSYPVHNTVINWGAKTHMEFVYASS